MDMARMAAESIYLIGLMGAGKTTIGKQLAKILNWPFYDSDKVIEESTGVDIPTIFEFEGEEGFRMREQKIIQKLTQIPEIILATGGGSILLADNRQILKEHGYVVYLQCSVERILERTRRDTQRPLLRTENPKKRLQQLYEQRQPLYLECADFKIDTGYYKSKTVISRILQEYKAAHPV